MAVHRRRRGGGPPPTPHPPPDQSDHRGKKTNLPLETSARAIFDTQIFGSQTPPLLILPWGVGAVTDVQGEGFWPQLGRNQGPLTPIGQTGCTQEGRTQKHGSSTTPVTVRNLHALVRTLMFVCVW